MKKDPIETYRAEAKQRLDIWSADISRLRAKAVLLESDARADAVRHLAELEVLYADVFREYVAMQVNVNGRLEDLQRAFEQAAEPLREALDQAERALV